MDASDLVLTWKDINCIARKRSQGFFNQKSSSLSLNWWFSIYGLSSMISTASFTTIRCSFVPISRINWCGSHERRETKREIMQCYFEKCWTLEKLQEIWTSVTYNGWKEGKPKVKVASWMSVTKLKRVVRLAWQLKCINFFPGILTA